MKPLVILLFLIFFSPVWAEESDLERIEHRLLDVRRERAISAWKLLYAEELARSARKDDVVLKAEHEALEKKIEMMKKEKNP